MTMQTKRFRSFRPLKIAEKVQIDPPLILAPLAGHTDRAFRGLIRSLGGCGLVITEMVSSEGLARGSMVSRDIAEVTEAERPVGVQVFGCEPERMGEAAAIVGDLGADIIDVNMGCPVPKVTRTGAGAALMQDTRRASAVISTMVRRTHIPVTVKIRSGWDRTSINASSVARVLEESGASAITVHPRCRSERHRGKAAWQVIADVKRVVGIPVIGNGDVRDIASARAMIAETGVDGIMIGRGALNNPWVFRNIVQEFSGEATHELQLADYQRVFEFFIGSLREYRPEKLVVNRVKAFIGWVTKGLEGGAGLRHDVYAAKNLTEVLGVFERYFEERKIEPESTGLASIDASA